MYYVIVAYAKGTTCIFVLSAYNKVNCIVNQCVFIWFNKQYGNTTLAVETFNPKRP